MTGYRNTETNIMIRKLKDYPHKIKPRGIYLLPNLFTAAGLFAGFYAIVAAFKNQFDTAAIAIFIAMLMDGLDGRIARLTRTQSAFGLEFDSLADLVSFGVAPALVIYSWSLFHFNKLGWLAAFLFTACGALRLARFNTQVDNTDKRYFQGLPIPAAAAVLASLVWQWSDASLHSFGFNLLTLITTVLTAFLMISHIRFHSFKQLQFRNKVPFIGIFIVIIVLIFVALSPSFAFFIIFWGYAISGPILTLHSLSKKHRLRRFAKKRRALREEAKKTD